MFNKVWVSLFGEDKEIVKNREIASLKEELNSLKNEIKKLSQDNIKKDSEIITLKNSINSLKNKLITIENKNISIYQDKEIEKLQNQIKSLEVELQNISEYKNEIIYKIDDFNTQYNIYLGETIEKLLKIKEEFLYKQFQTSKNSDDYEEYQQIKESYQEFHSSYENIVEQEKNKGIISKDEIKELKTIFRKTVKICHPDIVANHLKDKATTIMQELNSAYARLDIGTVRDIFDKLENGLDFVKEQSIDDKESLIRKIDKLKKAIKDEDIEIIELKQSESYLMVNSIEDFEEFFESQKIELEDEYEYILSQIESLEYNSDYDNNIEESSYSKKLRYMVEPNFDKIRRVCVDYINNHSNSDELHNNLDRGVKILDSVDELYQYIFSFGKMHKAKLYSAFDEVINQLEYETINVIDYGCGQALASSLLIDYLKNRNLSITISDINLIEPSKIALSRGVLHIDILKDNDILIKDINKDIDSLVEDDLVFNNKNITLHLFSNILDVKFFDLDNFINKISNSQNGLNYFICVSPNIGDSRNNRLDKFYNYFYNNFNTNLISKRESDIDGYKRYEIIFKVKL
ncbi:MAG: hypothetical protein U9Q30_00405 [Campylobacterota bacterium]|nr:hypothetical protein [Campylobacterota bacterium]